MPTTIFDRKDFAALRKMCGEVKKQPSAAEFKSDIESGELSNFQVAELKQMARYLKNVKGMTDVVVSPTKFGLLKTLSSKIYVSEVPQVEYRAQPKSGFVYVKVGRPRASSMNDLYGYY